MSSRTMRPLTEDERRELENLNDAVLAAIEARRTWLDAKMNECSYLQVGDDIYDLDKGIKLGRVTKLYRYWRDRDNGLRDNSVHCDYEYETAPLRLDNTSRQRGVSFGTHEEAVSYAVIRAREIRDTLMHHRRSR